MAQIKEEKQNKWKTINCDKQIYYIHVVLVTSSFTFIQ